MKDQTYWQIILRRSSGETRKHLNKRKRTGQTDTHYRTNLLFELPAKIATGDYTKAELKHVTREAKRKKSPPASRSQGTVTHAGPL